jgi:hypothetical protein
MNEYEFNRELEVQSRHSLNQVSRSLLWQVKQKVYESQILPVLQLIEWGLERKEILGLSPQDLSALRESVLNLIQSPPKAVMKLLMYGHPAASNGDLQIDESSLEGLTPLEASDLLINQLFDILKTDRPDETD